MDNDEMKAKDLIRGGGLTEGEEAFGGTPPGSTSPQEHPMRERPVRRPGPGGPGGPGGRSMNPRLPGGLGGPGAEEGPPGFFSRQEQSQLKDIIILMLAELMHSESDKRIGQALAAGKELDPGMLQHILDEASRLKLPPSHTPILQKIYQKLEQG